VEGRPLHALPGRSPDLAVRREMGAEDADAHDQYAPEAARTRGRADREARRQHGTFEPGGLTMSRRPPPRRLAAFLAGVSLALSGQVAFAAAGGRGGGLLEAVRDD